MKVRLCCSAVALAAASAPAFAQDPPPPVAPPPANVEGARTFTPADFARFAPRNALDMLRQVPGFTIREQTQERGLGQATGNVLINGKRVSGKSNDAIEELSQIPASNVIRIDIVDGATLDVPGLSGQVANIIAKATAKTKGQFSWSPDFRAYNTDPVLTRGDVSVSGKRGPIDYTLGFQNQIGHSGADGPTYIYNSDFSFREFRDDVFTGEFVGPKLSGR
ncbi:MAG: TonB-dependent receptor plug domain-containing protein, partial [Pseudomonadota bacterium]|nr:TonB-dependent receptor plug domain-containing protein [Pseudomonadota bacterium]